MTIAGFSESSRYPSSISLWSGDISDIPSGWALCDGNNGTPNLLGRFIKGHPSMSIGGNVAGEHSKQLSESQMAGHSHSASADEAGNHSHEIHTGGSLTDSDHSIFSGGPNQFDEFSRSSTSTVDGHSHGSTNTTSTGSGSSIENRPAYYEVAYIMRL